MSHHLTDDERVEELWDEQEQMRIDDFSSDPILDRLPAMRAKGQASRLLALLDELTATTDAERRNA